MRIAVLQASGMHAPQHFQQHSQQHFQRDAARRGVVLLVVIALLSLFAAVGLSFVFFADAEQVASKFNKEAATWTQPDIDSEQLLSFYLTQLIYDVEERANARKAHGLYSAMRGHSLARSLYGWDRNKLNVEAFAGVGRLSYNDDNLTTKDNTNLINFQWYPADGFIRDPERRNNRASATVDNNSPYIGIHVPWTYPDANNMFLAVMNADGELLAPSFHRDWVGLGSLDAVANLANLTATGAGNEHLKYMTLRPHRSVTTTDFPLPEDPGGDVRCLDFGKGLKKPGGGYYNNDAIWMDLGFPVMIAPNGQRFKPLFAAVVLDLGGKLDLSNHGNIRGDDGSGNPISVSNHGTGPWDVNLMSILNQGDGLNIFRGVSSPAGFVAGRYGKDGNPGLSGAVLPAGVPTVGWASWMGSVDVDAVQNPANTASTKYLMPGEAGNPNPAHFGFPHFPPASYGNGSAAERTNHPALFNFFNVGYAPPPGSLGNADDRIFKAAHLEALLRYGGSGSPSLGSDLFRLSPLCFASERVRRLVTTQTMDLGVVGARPWLKAPTAGTPSNYGLDFGTPFDPYAYPQGPAEAFPTDLTAFPNSGEFANSSWSYEPGLLDRLNLNRTLEAYPAPNASGRIIDFVSFKKAQQDRQDLAKDIYLKLRLIATGTRPGDSYMPDRYNNPADPDQGETTQYMALRWLAQLAVNIVDYRDSDDFITPFNWNTADAGEYVYGTELPRVVVNEAYVEYSDNIKGKGKAKGNGKGDPGYGAWVELHNPLMQDGNLRDNGNAKLEMPETALNAGDYYPIYRLQVCKINDPAKSPFTEPANSKGDPKYKNLGDTFPALSGGDSIVNFRDAPVLQAPPNPAPYKASGSNGVDGFFVLGPTETFPGTLAPSLQDTHMAYDAGNPATAPKPIFVLQRLLCPELDPNDSQDPLIAGTYDAAKPYNPYITVDYLDMDQGQMYDDAGNVENRYSWGRQQPLAGHKTRLKKQQPNPALMNEPQHTFFRHNGVEDTAPATNGDQFKVPFDWLVHINRPLTNPMELLHVSGYRPHELTQFFMTDTRTFGHASYRAWFDQRTRLFRFFEFVDTGIRAQGVSFDGRIPGKVNINAIWDVEVLRALLDARPGLSTFTEADVDNIYNNMLLRRSPSLMPGPNDQPFEGHAPGVMNPGGVIPATALGHGINNSMFRPADATLVNDGLKPRLFEKPGWSDDSHPYQRAEVISKLFNNVTTRSNVFGVWLTVGFFEVDTSNPPKLGKEIGKAEGRNIRRRMFAIIDRTGLSIPSNLTVTTIATPAPAMGDPTVTVEVNVQQISGIARVDPSSQTGSSYKLEAEFDWDFQRMIGRQVVIEPGTPNSEVVRITAVNPVTKTITADFKYAHGVGALIALPGRAGAVPGTILGNPGPQPGFRVRNNSALVLHYSIQE